MSADKFDNELSSLYQQRKSKIQAPELDLTSVTTTVKSQRSPWQMLGLLLTGGVASFGIMAVITHFAKPPVHGSSDQYKQHSVRVVEAVAAPEALLPATTAPLPVKPTSLPPKHSTKTRVSDDALALAQVKLSVDNLLNPELKIPKVKQAAITIVPTHRVMPEYPKSALYAGKSGTVKLQYRISAEGKVININALTQQGDRLFERSAKQALSQWRYPETSSSDQILEIEFEFNLAL